MLPTKRYDRAVGRQALASQSLGWSFWDMFSGPVQPAPQQPQSSLPSPSWSSNWWNPGVNQSYVASRANRSGGDTMLKSRARTYSIWDLWGPPTVGVEAYNRAQTQMLYGNHRAAKAELGDLFNDIMGAVVPGWDQRPDALKKIVVKPDPTKLLQSAQKISPGAGGQAVSAANAAGLDVYVNTPSGPVKVTPAMAQGLYANYPMYTQAQSFLSAVPMWVWIAGGAGAVALFAMSKR